MAGFVLVQLLLLWWLLPLFPLVGLSVFLGSPDAPLAAVPNLSLAGDASGKPMGQSISSVFLSGWVDIKKGVRHKAIARACQL